MKSRDYFPLGIATGAAFCNRTQETKLLTENIKNGKHSLLIATRRYGKSSLALHALKIAGLPYVEIDFYMARSEKVIASYLLNGVIELIGRALGPIDKFIASIKKYLKTLKPKLDIGGTVFKLELIAEPSTDPATQVKEALELLEQLLKDQKKQAVLLMDEFQNVGTIAKGAGIEAAIRHVAQKTKHLTIIFSGSNRKLLSSMFEDDKRPLYKLCWKITLKRIEAEHYKQHIQKVARTVWQQELPHETMSLIFTLTHRHPYYVNKLCDYLLVYYTQTPPSTTDVQKIWTIIVEEEKSDAVKEISLLPLGQKKVLRYIAMGVNKQISAKAAVLKLEMTSSSIISALNGLYEKDIIEQDNGQYQLVNPVVQYYAAL